MSARTHKALITLLVAGPLVGTVTAIVLLWNRSVFPSDLLLFAIFYPLTALGVTVGYHRMLTHRGFEASPTVRGAFLILGCMAFEGPPDQWAATHIKHHAHSDTEEDPHSPLEGFWHAHFGWLFSLKSFPVVQEYAPHLLRDRTVQFVSRTAALWMSLSLLLPLVLGGFTGFVWGGLVRIFLVNHVTWSVNSVCHCFGKRPFESGDESRNEWIVGLLGFGEGWHNNHHAFPENAFHGMRWWQFDLSGLLIRLFERVGLVWNVQRVSGELVVAKLRKTESVRAMLHTLREDLTGKIHRAQDELQKLLTYPLQTTLSEEQLAEMTASCARALKRVEEIKATLACATNVRKQKLLAYSREIQELVTQVKQKHFLRTV